MYSIVNYLFTNFIDMGKSRVRDHCNYLDLKSM